MIKVLVCEDQALIRQALVALLRLEPGISVVGEAVDGREAEEQVATLKPDVVLMGIRLPVIDGLRAIGAIISQHPDTRVIILTLTDYDSAEYVFEGMKSGAVGYLLTTSSAQELFETIRRVHRGERFIPPAIATKILLEFADAAASAASPVRNLLTERDVCVIQYMAQGLSNREIADEVGLAEGTIKNQVSGILAKLHATNRAHAISVARRYGII